MTEDLSDLNAEILMHTYELQELSSVIKSLDGDLIKQETPENLVFFQETLDRYKLICEKLRITLEAYFHEEARLELPAYITFRKLYKSLKKLPLGNKNPIS